MNDRTALIQCFRSGQMTEADFYARCEADPQLRKEWEGTKMSEMPLVDSAGELREALALAESRGRIIEQWNEAHTALARVEEALKRDLEGAEKLLITASLGSCECGIKSSELMYHDPGCRFVRLSYALERIESARKAWRNYHAALERQPRGVTPAEQGARDRKPHLVMTLEEYIASSVKGWHEVCRDVDGFGGIGFRYLTDVPPYPALSSDESALRAKYMEEAAKIVDGEADKAVKAGPRLKLIRAAAAIRSAAQKTGGGK